MWKWRLARRVAKAKGWKLGDVANGSTDVEILGVKFLECCGGAGNCQGLMSIHRPVDGLLHQLPDNRGCYTRLQRLVGMGSGGEVLVDFR